MASSKTRPARRDPLSTFFREQTTPGVEELADAKLIDVSVLEPNPYQPRRDLDDTALEELAQDIAAHGILQPLLVRPHPRVAGRYQIVAGERRWRAAQRAGLTQAPSIERALDDAAAELLALMENVQRADLNPVDEAQAYQRLMERFGLSLRDVAGRVHKHHEYVAQRLRLLEDPQVTAHVRADHLGPTVAQELVRVKDPQRRQAFLERAERGEKVTVQEVKHAQAEERRGRMTAAPTAVSNNSTDAPAPGAVPAPTAAQQAPTATDIVALESLRTIQLARKEGAAAPRRDVIRALRQDLAQLEQA